MLVRNYDNLPESMKNEVVHSYYGMLHEKRIALIFKRIFDVLLSLMLIILLIPLFLVVAVMIRVDSKGPVFFRQIRVTKNGRRFNILKFRTMYANYDDNDITLTVASDSRITAIGKSLRASRLDEIPQLFNILFGSMSFVGTRPEVVRYVELYTPEMNATLLLPAGLTSKASILFKNESEMLKDGRDAVKTYLEEILPSKMVHNLEYLRDYRFTNDIKILYETLFLSSN